MSLSGDAQNGTLEARSRRDPAKLPLPVIVSTIFIMSLLSNFTCNPSGFFAPTLFLSECKSILLRGSKMGSQV